MWRKNIKNITSEEYEELSKKLIRMNLKIDDVSSLAERNLRNLNSLRAIVNRKLRYPSEDEPEAPQERTDNSLNRNLLGL